MGFIQITEDVEVASLDPGCNTVSEKFGLGIIGRIWFIKYVLGMLQEAKPKGVCILSGSVEWMESFKSFVVGKEAVDKKWLPD